MTDTAATARDELRELLAEFRVDAPRALADAILSAGWGREMLVETPRRVPVERPRHYSPEPGDEFVRLRDLGPEHKGRIFEARDQDTGDGIVGYLEDANHYLLDGAVGIRFVGERLGMFPHPDAVLLLKRPDYELPPQPDTDDPDI